MYHYVEDKVFLHESYSICADLVNQLVQHLKHYDIVARMSLVGSGKRNMVTQNGNEPIDYDFNLILISVPNINDCRYIKETIMGAFDEVLDWNGLDNCKDSKSVITTSKIKLKKGNKTAFSIDLCIVRIDQHGYWHRLIHEKTGYVQFDRFFWNQGPNSYDILKKEQYIKSIPGLWQVVRKVYLEKKNGYLRIQNYFHPSFNCYVETINEVYLRTTSSRNLGFKSMR